MDGNEHSVNGTNSTDVDNGKGSSGGDDGEGEESATEADAEGITEAGEQGNGSPMETTPNGGFQPTSPPPEFRGATPMASELSTTSSGGEYEPTGTSEYDSGYEVYENGNGEPRGDNYRAYEDEYSYYKGRSYDGYDGHDYYYHQWRPPGMKSSILAFRVSTIFKVQLRKVQYNKCAYYNVEWSSCSKMISIIASASNGLPVAFPWYVIERPL